MSTSHAIFLGNFADADSDEFTIDLEDSSQYLGTFGSAGAPLSDQITDVTYNDVDNGATSIETNNLGSSDSISYDVGGSTVVAQVDSLLVVNATATYSNGSTQSFSNVVMYQDTSGNLFLTNSSFAGTDLNGPNNLPIQSINVTAITGDGYGGLYHTVLEEFICFAEGTLILTPQGQRPVQDLCVGDLVTTVDDGAQPVRWIGRRRIKTSPKLAPVVISAGALGSGLPHQDLRVSQQHRMLVRSRIVRRMLGTEEALVPAKRLVGLPGVFIAPHPQILTYLHLLFDRHQVVHANGAPCESLLPGPQTLKSMGAAAREEILTLFPEFEDLDIHASSARQIPPGSRQKKLVERHQKNARPLLEPAA